MTKIKLFVIAAVATVSCSCAKDNYVIPKGSDSVPEKSSSVHLKKEGNQWKMYVNDEPFYVNGAATNRYYSDVRKFGGNTVRLYSPSSSDTRTILDEAYQAGLMVYMGLGMSPAENMDYSDAEKVAAQKDRIYTYVKQYKDHPAILCWSTGNELEAGNENNINLWKAIGDIAAMCKDLDTNHLVTNTLAGSAVVKLKNLVKYAPDIDFVSVNSYYPTVGNVADNLVQAGVDIPYMITEFGPRGTWNMGAEPERILPWSDNFSSTSKALVEETSTEKEEIYKSVWKNDIKAKESAGCLGSFVFVWGYQTHGEVLNWYASHTTDKYSFGVCDAMQECWTGSYPSVRAPKIAKRSDMTMNGKVAEDAIIVNPGSSNSAAVVASTEAEVKLRYHWFIFKEGDHKTDGSMPDGIEGLIDEDGSATVSFKAPASAGGYRLYVFVLDEADKKAASACIPFCVATL